MAVALLTTRYGAILANMFALPIADKLVLPCKEEQLTKSLLIDAVMGIQSGQNPRVIEELLKTYLPGRNAMSKRRKKFFRLDPAPEASPAAEPSENGGGVMQNG